MKQLQSLKVLSTVSEEVLVSEPVERGVTGLAGVREDMKYK